MAHCLGDEDGALDTQGAGDQGVLRRCRGRPRLTDSDRAQRRLESRKKYDVRRVYLGESHKLWSELRRRTSLSDAGLAEYLILLNSTYGEKHRQKHCGWEPEPLQPCCLHESKQGRKQRVSSLQSLVCWYQEHSGSCPHEPQLQALEPQPDFSTAAKWQCDSNHSFVQYLFSPLREPSDSEPEERGDGDSDEEGMDKMDTPLDIESMSRQRRREAHQLYKDVGQNVSEEQCTALIQTEEASGLHRRSSPEASSGGAPLTGQPAWEVEMVQQQGSLTAALHSIPAEDLKQGEDGGEGVGEQHREEGIRTAGHGYELESLADELEKTDEDSVLSQSLNDPVPLGAQHELSVPPPAQGQTELFDPQTAVTSCEIPNQRTALEGSQLIIITGSSYEALASEGIQLNMGSGNVEEVTCTVIGGLTYNQVCTPDSNVPTAPDEDSLTGLSDTQLDQPAVEQSSNQELDRSLSRSRRSRRGPVVEADGMLKMFHCPYEGCSQVYVAISSFQNHVNLVHRKGRTKVCPHPGCGKKFYLSNHLHRHMIIHSGVRDFICETCGKSFKRKNHLEVHRRTHTGETPLQCEICGYQCRQRASLNWHMKKHTPEAHYNYTCEFCSKRFEKLDSVKFHKLKSHSEKLTS
ncbi:zinc finger protein 653 [Nematolebias whitei]|uniref:zinc finger protein 653 n=1 Tax=Nematolebias whitei TaxID=451745 RepID=UPI001899A44F|nr:zinc finger protein 653 [Nematolebias whitei]